MGIIGLKSVGDYSQTTAWLESLLQGGDLSADLDKYGQMGVDALVEATPKRTGTTAAAWGYRVINNETIEWYNTNINDGEEIAVLIQYGHGTGTGGYVAAIDYINPALEPVIQDAIHDFVEAVNR
jgi:hypothetical protein